jgi:osmotically inducible protein OsmC
MATAERQAHVTWQGDLKGSGQFDTGSGAIGSQQVTWASRTEEPEGHTSPEELIAAAHASCYAMAFSNTLAKAGNAPEKLEVTAKVTFDTGSGKVTTSELDVEGTVAGLDQSGFEEAARTGERACPVSNALRNNVDIRLNARLAQ